MRKAHPQSEPPESRQHRGLLTLAGMKYEDLPLVSAYRDIVGTRATSYGLKHGHGGERILTGAYQVGTVRRAVPDWIDDRWRAVYRMIAAVQVCRADAIASHWSAAILHGWPLPKRMPARFQVSTPVRRPPVRIAGIDGRRSRHLAAENLWGLRVASLPVTLIHIAPDLTHESAVVVLEALLGTWRGAPAASVRVLTEFLEQHRNFAGRPTLLRALNDARPGVGSPKETEVRRALVLAGLPEPAVQPAVWLPKLQREVHPDLGYVEERVAVEYEGDQHRIDSWQWESDIRRYAAFTAAGWIVVRVTARTTADEAVAEVRGALQGR